MNARHFTVTLAAAATRLSEAYGAGTAVGGSADIPYRQLLFNAESADAFVGASDVSATVYGVKVDSAENLPVVLGPFDQGPLKLSDLYAAGAGATLHILGIPY